MYESLPNQPLEHNMCLISVNHNTTAPTTPLIPILFRYYPLTIVSFKTNNYIEFYAFSSWSTKNCSTPLHVHIGTNATHNDKQIESQNHKIKTNCFECVLIYILLLLFVSICVSIALRPFCEGNMTTLVVCKWRLVWWWDSRLSVWVSYARILIQCVKNALCVVSGCQSGERLFCGCVELFARHRLILN